jgi:hypothetical protein
VLATELDENAARCARRNGVEVFEGFLDDPLPRGLERRVDVLTAVVPYVPTDSLRLLPRDARHSSHGWRSMAASTAWTFWGRWCEEAQAGCVLAAGYCWNWVVIRPNR